MRCFPSIVSIAMLGALAGPAFAVLDPVVLVDLTGVQIKNATPQNRSSAPMQLDASTYYKYEVDGMVKGSGLVLGLLFPNPTPLGEVLETFSPGASELLTGSARNLAGTHPFIALQEDLDGSGTYAGIDVIFTATLTVGVDASNFAYFSLTNVVISPAALVGSLTFTSGTASVESACYADCDESGTLDFFDFLCFQNEFTAGTAYGDCDVSGVLDFFDFLCFQNEFTGGCP